MMVSTTLQTVVSTAVDEHSQGRTLGSVASLNSLTAVAAPVIGSFLLQLTAHYPHGDWRIGAPFYLCAALQVLATVLAIQHFRRHPSPLKPTEAEAAPT